MTSEEEDRMTKHGFYVSPARMAYPHQVERYYADMAANGLTTATADGSATFCPADPAVGLACNIEALLQAGLAEPGKPLLCFADPDTAYKANRLRTREWPEIILNNYDDPSPGDIEGVQAIASDAHELYFKSSLFVNGNFVKERKIRVEGAALLGEAVDIWIVQAHTWQPDIAKNAQALGKQVWSAYTVGAAGRYEHMRYYAGLLSWARRVDQCLTWAYTHDRHTMIRPDDTFAVAEGDNNSYAIPRMDGTVHMMPGYAGLRAGIEDCRLLERAEAGDVYEARQYLANVRAMVPFAMPRPGRDLPALRGPAVAAELARIWVQHGGQR
jgi:hypothetical protein